MAAPSVRVRKRKKIQRRTPQRTGSRATVEAIFQATARILSREGRAGLNTNRIAELAGVSIGTLYGYFPDKQAILLSMARSELDRARDQVAAALTRRSPHAHPARVAVRALIGMYAAGGRTRRILMETLFAHGGSEELARPVQEIAELILANAENILPREAGIPSRVELYVLTRALDGIVRTAVYDGMDFVSSKDFEDSLLRLAFGFFGASVPDV